MLTGHGNDEVRKNEKMNIKPDYISKDLYGAGRIIGRRLSGLKACKEEMVIGSFGIGSLDD